MSVATAEQGRTVDEIVNGLKDHVWTLLRAQRVDAAMVLLAAELDAYLEATGTMPEPRPAPPKVNPPTPLEGIIVQNGSAPTPAEMNLFQPDARQLEIPVKSVNM